MARHFGLPTPREEEPIDPAEPVISPPRVFVLADVLAAAFAAHCARRGDAPADVLADLIRLEIDREDVVDSGDGAPC